MSSLSTTAVDAAHAPRRLIILGSSITALAIARDAHGLGLTPFVVDISAGIAHRSALVEPVVLGEESEAARLARLVALGGADACLIATADVWICFIRANRTALDKAYGALLHPSNAALDICLSKSAFAEWCVAHGFDAPRCCRAEDADCLRSLRYPVLVRPSQTLHHRTGTEVPKAAEVRTPEELATLVERFHAAGAAPLVAESLLGRRLTQYSVPFARRGGETISFVARKVRPPADWCATGTCVELAPHADVEGLARRAVEALDYFGIGEVEILHAVDENRSYLVEINARPWLQYALATASGHGFLEFLLRPGPGTRGATVTEGLTWLSFVDDLYVCFSRSQGIVRGGRLGFMNYLRSVLKANVHARFSWRDPMPWLWDTLQWLKSMAGR